MAKTAIVTAELRPRSPVAAVFSVGAVARALQLGQPIASNCLAGVFGCSDARDALGESVPFPADSRGKSDDSHRKGQIPEIPYRILPIFTDF